MKKTILTITGIRPDFIRMSEIFRKLDKNFHHICIHTGQHFDNKLSDIFFKDLNLRQPDYNLKIGSKNRKHYEQQAVLGIKIIELIYQKNLKPDAIIFLGDSNSVLASVPLKKEGYKIIHIESLQRSFDKKMLEEINRIVCDHVSDYHFTYHEDYKQQGLKEGLKSENIFVVGNTITEVCNFYKQEFIHEPKKNEHILLDIHRPENFLYKERLKNIIEYAKLCSDKYDLPVYFLGFKRTMSEVLEQKLLVGADEKLKFVELYGYKDFLKAQYHSKFIISDSGTAQEEPALLNTPVIVPRDFTERPQSVQHNCSFMLNVNSETLKESAQQSFDWLNSEPKIDASWLGDGTTSKQIVTILKEIL
jgi:UDP-N-acetylglucosamine 2-epimerase (non-hydrolysing)